MKEDSEKNVLTGRVVEEYKTNYLILRENIKYSATVRGAFHLDDGIAKEFPKVGDYVEFEETAPEKGVILRIVPRKTQITRKAVESDEAQVIVANVDLIFIVMGLDGDFNLRRLERYLMLAGQSKIKAVVILNKADTVSDPETYLQKTSAIAGDSPVHAVSAKGGQGMEIFLKYITGDTTAVLLGSSGAGKSTITNWLLEQNKQATKETREDDSRGKHTTTRRELFNLPKGGFLIDTPGMRELGMMSEETEGGVFADVEVLMLSCRYSDCDHEKSEGCAIQEAIAEGKMDAKHFQNYLKLKKEQAFMKRKVSDQAFTDHKQKVKRMHKHYKKIQKEKYEDR